MKKKQKFHFINGIISLAILFSLLCNLFLFTKLHLSKPQIHQETPSTETDFNQKPTKINYQPLVYTAERYKIDSNSKKPTLDDNPKWPPMKVYVYPENKYHTEECLYPPEMPNRYVNESGYWFQRMLEPTIHHQLLNSPILTTDPNEADLFFIPHYSRMCSGLDSGERWEDIPRFLRENGNFFNRYSSLDHFVVHSVPNYGDKPADRAVINEKAPMVAILDLKLSSIKNNPWLLSRTTIVPFITMPTADDFTSNDRPISVFVAMSTSTKGLKASSAMLRQKIEEQLRNVTDSEIVVINRKEYNTFKRALDSLPLKMTQSKYCIVPPGDAPSSKRFYDAISYSCVPFMLADYFILPYEGVAVDYEKCMKQLPSKEVETLSSTLNRDLKDSIIRNLRNNLKDVKEKFTWNYRQMPKAGQGLWTLTWALYDKIQMLKPYENNEMTGYDDDPVHDWP